MEELEEKSSEAPLDLFSAERAWADLTALEALGPRPAGTEAANRARKLIGERLAEVGITLETIETSPSLDGLVLRHGVATLPGASSDLILLVAPFDSGRYEDVQFLGTNDGASGAALLVELARVLTTRVLPYTIRLVFLEGEGATLDGGRHAGSKAYAAMLEAAAEVDRVRLLVAFNQVCDQDLQIARDLHSHRMHREEFFRIAHRLGHADAFPLELGFESVASSHTAFGKRGIRPIVAVMDTRFGGIEVPGFYAATADDNLQHCAAKSLETVGVVTLEALDAIGRRLSKIDRFSRAPLAPLETTPATTPQLPAKEAGAEVVPQSLDSTLEPPAPSSGGAPSPEEASAPPS